MKRLLVTSLVAFALLLAVSGIVGGIGQTASVMAQEGTPVPTVAAQPARPVEEDNDFPWGLLGLLGLGGLAGLRRQEQPVQREVRSPKNVGTYDQK